MHNPERGFLSSANQLPYDTSYPYYLAGRYPVYRGYIINRTLSGMHSVSVEDMERLQTSNYNVFAEMARPVLLKYIDEKNLGNSEKKYLDVFRNWDLKNDSGEAGATVFKLWWDSLMTTTFSDEFSQSALPLPWPEQSTLLDGIKKDSTGYPFADNINTPQRETVATDINIAFKQAAAIMQQLDSAKRTEWGKFKESGIRHLLRIPALSRLNLMSGGEDNCINAYTKFHGPSWRMVVELTDKTNAYGIYPGGQDGNPGSKYYDDFINDWLVGKYYKLLFVDEAEISQLPGLKGKISFSKS
jgi:penicillin amidase